MSPREENRVTAPVREAFLRQFSASWKNWSYREKPHCFWLCEFGALESERPESVPVLTWANRVWLLDENGLVQKSPLDWRRFELLVRDFAASPFSGGVHEVAMGCFAPTSQLGTFYYEEIWGGRWGMGANVRLNENTGQLIGDLVTWRS